MSRKRQVDVFNISFLDLLSGALGAVIILFIAVPKNDPPPVTAKEETKVSCTTEKELIKKCTKLLRETNEELADSNQKVVTQKEIIEKLKNQVKEKEEKLTAKSVDGDKKGGHEHDVGFKFKGKKIVFLIDVSGSMQGEKIGQVKAGLKMLIASMGKEYSVDIIHFPNGTRGDYYPLWGMIQPLSTLQVKHEVYNFLSRLRPNGFTPTRSALLYAVQNYPGLTDIVLLSDGAPTVSGSRNSDNFMSIVKDVQRNNTREIQINTIGVGAKTFRNNSTLHKFLKKLSDETGGFFYGF
jgi:uncharacterized protein with von Willebrand factor type A (vWA) domain